MKASETVIEYDKTEVPAFWQGVINAALKDQAEHTWPIAEKAGMGKVVEWVEEYNWKRATTREEWQQFLKDNGIEVKK